MVKEIVSRKIKILVSLKQIQKRRKRIFVSMYLAINIIQATNYPTIRFPSRNFPEGKSKWKRIPCRFDTRTYILIHIRFLDRFRESNVTKEMAS